SSTVQLGGNDTWHHLVGVCDESNGVISLYIDGLLTAQTAVAKGAGVLPLAATSPITIGASTTAGTGYGDHQFDGALDDAAIFNYALSSGQVIPLYQAAGGQISLNLVAPLPPTNAVWRQNSTLTIPAFAVGAPPIGYYWTNVTTGGILGGANIKGGSGVSAVSTLTATLTITNAPPSYSGDLLELVVTNANGMTNWFTTLFSYPPPITIGYTNSILYSNQFDGGTWNLAGTATTEANTLVGGTNSTWTDALGTNDTGSMEGSGLDNSTLGDSWILPFKPEPGYVYTINASVYMTGYPGSWIGTGFAGPVTSNNSGSARFADPDIYGYDFIIWVINTGNVEFLQGPGAALYITNVNSFIATTTPITHTAQVVLDTTGSQWVQYAFMDGTPAGTNVFATIPPIGSVGLTQSGLGAPNDVQWTSFSLTQVAPGGVPPYLMAPLPSTNTITLPNPTTTFNVSAFGSAPMGYYWLNNSTVLASGVTNTPNPVTPNNAAPISASITIPTNTLAGGSLELVVTNAYGTNITAITLVSPPPSFTHLTWGVTNGNLYLSWPSQYIGGQLQSQTNSVGVGLSTNWVNCDPNGPSTATNMVVVPVNTGNGTVFYRLHP
ncbi:MAG TPA: LamG-like jellyroll fold domain-containing protein, partial [Verrucomicrobiae bacterium]|nr:LamG-like jellyroll fold domain-containing protein [Verrucomicrobiae bacterium]